MIGSSDMFDAQYEIIRATLMWNKAIGEHIDIMHKTNAREVRDRWEHYDICTTGGWRNIVTLGHQQTGNGREQNKEQQRQRLRRRRGELAARRPTADDRRRRHNPMEAPWRCHMGKHGHHPGSQHNFRSQGINPGTNDGDHK